MREVELVDGDYPTESLDVTERICEADGCCKVGNRAEMVQLGEAWYCPGHADDLEGEGRDESRRTLQAGRWEDVERAQRILDVAAKPLDHDGHPTFSHVGHALVCLAESLGVIEPWTNVIEKGPVPVDGAAWEASVYRRQLDGGFVLLLRCDFGDFAERDDTRPGVLTVCTVEETPIQYERLYELAYHAGCKLNGIEPLGYHPGKDGPKP